MRVPLQPHYMAALRNNELYENSSDESSGPVCVGQPLKRDRVDPIADRSGPINSIKRVFGASFQFS